MSGDGSKKRPINLVDDDDVVSPINALPNDILVTVCRFATAVAADRYSDLSRMTAIARLSRCCRTLRRVVDAMPIETVTAATAFLGDRKKTTTRDDVSVGKRWQRCHHRVRRH